MQQPTAQNTAQNFANRYGYSDVEPFEVIRVVSDKTLEVRLMTATLDPTWKPEMIPGGFAAHCVNQSEQRWIITPNESAPVIRIRKHKDGFFYNHGSKFRLSDKPCRFYDYNF